MLLRNYRLIGPWALIILIGVLSSLWSALEFNSGTGVVGGILMATLGLVALFFVAFRLH